MAGELRKDFLMLPMNRVKIIMRSSPETQTMSHDAIFVATKLTELFVRDLMSRVYKNAAKKVKVCKSLNYNALADLVHVDTQYEFLEGSLPRKITFGQYKEMMKKKLEEKPNSDEEEEENEEEEEMS